MILTPSDKIYLNDSEIDNAGRGIYAAKLIKKDEIIEKCPVVILSEKEVPNLRKTKLVNYYFMWGINPQKDEHKAAICLGFGSIYNHSYTPNATYIKRIDQDMVEFLAIRDIEKDEEITVNYNHGNPDDKTTLWIKEIPPAE